MGDESISNKLTYLLIGGGIGAILALLFAPKSGQELRGDIADATRKGIDRSREAAQQLGDRAGEYYEATRGRAAELYSQAAERVSEVAQSARDAMSRAHYQAHVAELGQRVIAVRDLDEVAAAVPGITARALGADAVLLYLLGAHDTEFVCRGSYGGRKASTASGSGTSTSS